jgi:hypothetical protein
MLAAPPNKDYIFHNLYYLHNLFMSLTIGMLSLATMVHFPAEMAALDDSSIRISSSQPALLIKGEATTQANLLQFQPGPVLPSLATTNPTPAFPIALWLLVAGAPILAFLLIALSRWQLPATPPLSEDPARHLHSSLR